MSRKKFKKIKNIFQQKKTFTEKVTLYFCIFIQFLGLKTVYLYNFMYKGLCKVEFLVTFFIHFLLKSSKKSHLHFTIQFFVSCSVKPYKIRAERV